MSRAMPSNKPINSDSKKRRSFVALLFAAGYGPCSAAEAIVVTVELKLVSSSEDWNAYHSIRQHVLWEARGRHGSYDRSHPDEHKAGNFPCLLMVDGMEPTGAIRIDLDPPLAWFRRVAIRDDRQRQGYGRKMLELAADFARARGCNRVRSNVDHSAVEFYQRLGFQILDESEAATVPMTTLL